MASLLLSIVSLALDDLPIDDANVMFVSGWIGRGISRKSKCFACRELFVTNLAANLATLMTACQMRINSYFCKLMKVNYMLLRSSIM